MEKTEKSAVSGVKVLDIYSQAQKPQTVLGRNYHSLSYRYTGKIKIEANGNEYTSDVGSITFIPKGQGYRTDVCEDTHMVALHFTLQKEIKDLKVGVIDDKEGIAKPYFDRLAAGFANAEPQDFEAMAIFYQLLSKLSEIGNADRAIPPIVALAKSEIDANFQDSLLSISAIATRLEVSDSYLRRVFRQSYGISPLAYLTEVRIRRAKNMLETEFFSIEEIGRLCGFQSAGYFIQCFRKENGETPGNYRKRKRGIIV